VGSAPKGAETNLRCKASLKALRIEQRNVIGVITLTKGDMLCPKRKVLRLAWGYAHSHGLKLQNRLAAFLRYLGVVASKYRSPSGV